LGVRLVLRALEPVEERGQEERRLELVVIDEQ
jgi:hypothetical protein